MNKERVLALRDRIWACEHERDDTRQVYAQDKFTMSVYYYACGSPACVAGHAIAMWGEEDGINSGSYTNTESLAKILDVTLQAARDISTPESLKWYEDITPRETADMLERLAETGIVDWRLA